MLSTDIEAINSQHRVLVALINKLCDAANDGLDKEVLGDVLMQMNGYTAWHFAAEAGYMTAYWYPCYKEHAQQHKKLMEQVMDIRQQFEIGRIAMTMDVAFFSHSTDSSI